MCVFFYNKNNLQSFWHCTFYKKLKNNYKLRLFATGHPERKRKVRLIVPLRK